MGRLRPLISTPEDVFKFTEPTPTLITSSNGGNFQLTNFEIKDEEGTILGTLIDRSNESQGAAASPDEGAVRVQLSSDYLKCSSIVSKIEFKAITILSFHTFNSTVLSTYSSFLVSCLFFS